MKIILIYGDRGSGKTGCCEKIIFESEKRKIKTGGVICPAILNRDKIKTGCLVYDLLTGFSMELGSNTRTLDGPFWKKWSFSECGFTFANKAIKSAMETKCDIIFLDEIGPLEFEKAEGLWSSLEMMKNAFSDNTYESMVIVLTVRTELLNKLQDFFPINYVISSTNFDFGLFYEQIKKHV